jgi:elongation factor G
VHDLSAARGGSVISLDAEDESSSSFSSSDTETTEQREIVDVNKIYAPPDPFAGTPTSSSLLNTDGGSGSDTRHITARVPLKEMVGYLKHLRSLTGGRGTFTMGVEGFERMGVGRVKAVVEGLRR